MEIKKLEVGKAYTKDTLKKFFQVGDSGGIRYSAKNNLLVLTQSMYDNPYQDSINWDDNVIYYVGTGSVGDQSIDYRENKRLYNSNKDKSNIFLFFRDFPNHNIYFGTAKLISVIDSMRNLDRNNEKRKIIVFRLKLNSLDDLSERNILNSIYNDIVHKNQIENKKEAYKKTTKALIKNVKQHEINSVDNGKKVGKINTKTTVYDRNQYLVELSIRMSKGICQLCGSPAPFKKDNGDPFLEVHHIDWLSKGGADSIYNVIAICPNCHRKMHILKEANDIVTLKNKAKSFADSNGFNRI